MRSLCIHQELIDLLGIGVLSRLCLFDVEVKAIVLNADRE